MSTVCLERLYGQQKDIQTEAMGMPLLRQPTTVTCLFSR